MRLVVGIVIASGCGRVAFDPGVTPAADADATSSDASSTVCLDDDLADGTAAWQGDWFARPGDGPDGSAAVGVSDVFNVSGDYAWLPELVNLTSIDLAFDFLLEHPNADLNVLLLNPGWIDNASDGYDVAAFPRNGDSSPDRIVRNLAGESAVIAMAVPSYPYNTWHRLRVARSLDATLLVALDGVEIMKVDNADVAPPFEVAFRVYFGAVLDNVIATCTR